MEEETDLTIISTGGDLILKISQEEEGGDVFSFRVDSSTLQQNSKYFEKLLSDRFSEGKDLIAALATLDLSGLRGIAVATLPHISIVNVGRISKVSSIKTLTADFLRTLHGLELAVANPPVANLANLAVVADRFDALEYLSKYVRRKKWLQAIDAKAKSKANTTLTEGRVRQKLLIGLLLDHSPWVTQYSKHLIMRDSEQWKPDFEPNERDALWWDLPRRVEEEMIQRREYILETISSLQSHFLKLYYSGQRQCKLGYDSSVQCDSFQLGEMVRFFAKLGTIRLQSTIYDNTEPEHYSGDIDRLLDYLRQSSSYQVDRNHTHCGLRARLIPLLDLIQNHLRLDTASIDIGICAQCWSHNRPLYAWSSAKRPVLWTPGSSLTGGRPSAASSLKKGHQRSPSSCLARHNSVRDMFMAVDKEWTAGDALMGPGESFGSMGKLPL
ncbi:hypothetical protein BCR34DRAFT_525746 [Clohesyomyces aquaticus]|uniref:BTB domain-containing protein n=1 Tax=Clohesyomyces aquaticus TaxID=1231657 RepID=A0A1Y1YAP2_9PLEO|nr:hypothetical protein BCR34DRAFT_525746 [Clohesyomyces aquaticus]